MKKITKNVLIILCLMLAISGILIILNVGAYSFINDHLTRMQVFKKKYIDIISAYILLSSALYVFNKADQ